MEFLDRALALHKQGYKVLPIKNGAKGPILSEWQNLRATPAIIEGWARNGYANGNVGILTKDTPAVDLDIYDKAMADAMEAWMLKEFGNGLLVRVGQAPKRLMLFRTRKPFKKMLVEYKNSDAKHRIEVLAHGQQFVAYGIHPGTQCEYEWTSFDEPLYTCAADLPELTEADIGLIFDKFESLAREAGWERVSRTDTMRGSGADGAAALERYKPRVQATLEEIRDILDYVPNKDADYDRYLDIGFALHHQFDGDEMGLKLWHEWAEQSDKYDPDDIARRWISMGHGPDTKTFATVKYWADQARKKEDKREWQIAITRIELAVDVDLLYNDIIPALAKMELDDTDKDQALQKIQIRIKELTQTKVRIASLEKRLKQARPKKQLVAADAPAWVRDWIYVQNGNCFYQLTQGTTLAPRAFDSTYGRMLLSDEDRATGNSFNGKASDAALNLYEIPTVYAQMYLPGEEPIVNLNGQRYVNTYNTRTTPVPKTPNCADDFRAIETVEKHFAVLFPDKRERDILLDYLAFTVQFPASKINWAILIQGVDGAGKSWMSDLMSAVLGGVHVASVPGAALKEKYTKWAEGKKLVFLEEVRMHGANKYEIIDRMKTIITNRSIAIRKMGSDLYEVVNVTNYILFTNYDDALPLDRNDRRYAVLRTAFLTKGSLQRFVERNPGYFDRLFQVLMWNVDVISDWLLKRQISPDFQEKGHAPDTDAKEMMREVHEGNSDVDYLDELVKEGADPEISDDVLNVSRLRSSGNFTMDQRALGHFLKQAGFIKVGRFRLQGRDSENVNYYTRNDDLFSGLSTPAKMQKLRDLIARVATDDGFGD